MKLKGSQTEKNLLIAFAGESQARNRYTYFASQAKKEGYEQIAAIFEETANQEREHAKREFKFLEGGEVEITAAYPAGVIGKQHDREIIQVHEDDRDTVREAVDGKEQDCCRACDDEGPPCPFGEDFFRPVPGG